MRKKRKKVFDLLHLFSILPALMEQMVLYTLLTRLLDSSPDGEKVKVNIFF